MKGGDWIWVMLALFGLFRLLLLAGKKKREGASPPPPGPRRSPPAPPRSDGDVDRLKQFIDKLTDQFGVPPRPVPPASQRQRLMRTPPPPPRYGDEGERPPRHPRSRKDRGPKSSHPPLPGADRLPPVEAMPDRPALPGLFSYSSDPVIQGIIFFEILGPPRSLRGENRLPSDPGT
ncbi:MAG: hypothetical protein V1789_09060 [PVC group bacterium]